MSDKAGVLDQIPRTKVSTASGSAYVGVGAGMYIKGIGEVVIVGADPQITAAAFDKLMDTEDALDLTRIREVVVMAREDTDAKNGEAK